MPMLKTLISYAGSAEQLFKNRYQNYKKINGVGPKLAAVFSDTKRSPLRAEKK